MQEHNGNARGKRGAVRAWRGENEN